MADWDAIKKVADAYAEAEDADVILWNGETERPHDHDLIHMCRTRKRRERVLFILVSPGGDAHAAYRIARCLQRNWKRVAVFVPGWCKSAGTLLAIGAHELIIGDCGELGPVDVQRPKEDELWESSSGLTEDAALGSLESSAMQMFDHFVFEIKRISRGQVSFSLAAEVAGGMTRGLLEPIFAQIDPAKIGESSRAMNIAKDYGLRLAAYSENLKDPRSIDKLVSSYSSHGFVIDREEAELLFENVTVPDDHDPRLEELCTLLGETAYNPGDTEDPLVRFLNTEKSVDVDAKEDEESADARTQVIEPEGKRGIDADAGADSGRPDGAAAAVSASNVASIGEAPKLRRGPPASGEA